MHWKGCVRAVIKLTQQQKNICEYIRTCTSLRGYPPTVREIAAFLGVSSDGDYFALMIRGDSMKNAGILDGDTVVVRKQSTARSGEIVIALLEDEATCKRLDTSTGHVWLLPENAEYAPIDGENAVLLGKVTAVVRRY